MAYKALYRKYRPKNFNEVAGQNIIVQILKNSIIADKISHAYLFYGPRGTGKTSIAKIFAKTVNCDSVEDGIPCGKCKKCIENEKNGSIDIIEIDAASNNGVDEIRELKGRINLVPSLMKYKVYIIDEVHMLSIGAFNALLKTLEEPPNHVIFILATTELNKVPNTIISRCQLMEFRKISDKDMFTNLKKITELEKINIDDASILEIAKYSDGCMRDALGLLDKLSLYSSESIDISKVRDVCGNASLDDINLLIEYIKNHDQSGIVEKIDELYLRGIDLVNITNDIVITLKDELLTDRNNYISFVLLNLIDTIDKLKKSSNPRIVLEASILSIINDAKYENISREIFSQKEQSKSSDHNILNDVESFSNSSSKNVEKNHPVVDQEKFKLVRVNNTFVSADKTLLNEIKGKWKNFENYTFDKKYGSLAAILVDSFPVVCNESYLVLMTKYDSLSYKLNDDYLSVEEFISKIFNRKFKIVSLSSEEWNNMKNEYIAKMRNNEKYSFMSEELIDSCEKENNNIENTAFDDLCIRSKKLFGSDNVIVK